MNTSYTELSMNRKHTCMWQEGVSWESVGRGESAEEREGR